MKNSFEKTVKQFSKQEQGILALAGLFIGEFSVDWIIELSEKKPSEVILALENGVLSKVLTKTRPTKYQFINRKTETAFNQLIAQDKVSSFRQKVAEIILSEVSEGDIQPQESTRYLLDVQNNLEGCEALFHTGLHYAEKIDNQNALRCFSKALDDLIMLDGDDSNLLLFKTTTEYCKIAYGLVSTERIFSIIQSARERAAAVNNKPWQALLDMNLARGQWIVSNHEEAIKYFKKGWTTFKELDDPQLTKSAVNFSIFFLTWQGRFREAAETYEKARVNVENYTGSGFFLSAFNALGCCYIHIGQVSQGFGVLDAIRHRSIENKKPAVTITSLLNMSSCLLMLGRADDALQLIKASRKQTVEDISNQFFYIFSLLEAYTYYIKKDYKKTKKHLLIYLKYCSRLKVADTFFGFTLSLCWAMEQEVFPSIEGINLNDEIKRCLKLENILMKGIAYRYKALLLLKKKGLSPEISQMLQASLDCLEESGHVIETVRTRVEFANFCTMRKQTAKAKQHLLAARKIIFGIDTSFVPEDLQFLVEKELSERNLLRAFLDLSRVTVTQQNEIKMIQRIISIANRITGSERGALFITADDSPSKLQLKAAQNLTENDVQDPGFKTANKMMVKALSTGDVQISKTKGNTNMLDRTMIRSRICIPFSIMNNTTGVIYLDNRLFESHFSEADWEILSYFAAQAAIAIEQVRAYEEISKLNKKLEEEKQYYEEQFNENVHFEEIIGQGAAIKSVLNQVSMVAAKDTTVLILGETGVGKELIARAIHKHSTRSEGPFIRVHCAALPQSLISSELFGHEKGAFTGATQKRIGRFELANCGTIFLDEIGEIPMELQIKLLRVLQTGEFERVGGGITVKSNFRLLTATNKDLGQMVKEGKFREDLYYRLNVFPITVPPIKERKEDIPLLALYFLKRYAQKLGKAENKISTEEMEKLTQYEWPGNVRELENVIERGTILSVGSSFIAPELGTSSTKSSEHAFLSFADNERAYIHNTLNKTDGKVKGPGGAAELMKIPEGTLRSKMKKLGIQRRKR